MGKRKLVELTLEKKKEVLDLLKIGESCRKLAEKYGISKSTVSNINSNRAAITDAWEKNCNAHRKRLRKTPHDELNDKVLEFFRCCRAKNIPISGTLLQEKAREIATRLHTEDFSASNGWLDRFRKRNNISLHVLSGESASASLQAAEDWKRKLPSLLLGYAEEDIFNADETGLFYRQLPTRSLIEMRETCKGGKKSKEQITVLLCCNSRGEKLKPLVIGNAARPRAFKTNNVKLDDLPVIWCYNKKAWMTSKKFSEGLNDINLKIKRANRKILLFVDNAISHISSNLSNVSIQFLPPNLTSEVQPLDKGIIQSVKLLYRKQLMHSLINAADKCKDVTEFSRSVTVLDAIRWIPGAWAEVSPQTIAKCFRHAGFMADFIEDEGEGMEEDSFHEEINCLPEEYRNQIPDVQALSTFDNILEVHDDVAGTIDNVLDKVMTSSDDVCKESSEEEELSMYEEPPTHQRALQCMEELERYGFAHNQPAMVETLFGLRRKLERGWANSKTKAKKQCLVTDFFTRIK